MHRILKEVVATVKVNRASAIATEGEGFAGQVRAVATADTGLEFQGGAVVDVVVTTPAEKLTRQLDAAC